MRTHLEQLRRIFTSALEFSSQDERTAYLDKVCGDDPALRLEIESLLSAHPQAEDYLQPFVPNLFSTPPSCFDLTKQIGPYKLREQIGEGGFGVVYVAEQTAPVRREVALKIIKPGMDTKEVIARFEAEKQALAMMDHEGRALSLTTTRNGQSPISGGRDGVVRVWSPDLAAPRWFHFNCDNNGIARGPNHRLDVAGHQIRLWDLNQGRLVTTFAAQDPPGSRRASSADRRFLAAVRFGQLALFDQSDHRRRQGESFRAHGSLQGLSSPENKSTAVTSAKFRTQIGANESRNTAIEGRPMKRK